SRRFAYFLIVTGSFFSSAMWITRFSGPGFEHSQFPLLWATVLWHRGRVEHSARSLAERPKKPQLSRIFERQVMLTGPHGRRGCGGAKNRVPPRTSTVKGVSDERRHRHRECRPHPGRRIQWGICEPAGP